MKLDERAQQASRAVQLAVEGVFPKPLPSRRVIAVRRAIAIALVLVAIAGYFSNELLDNLANLRVDTADQPPSEVKEETSGEEGGKSDSSAPGPVSSAAPGKAGGTSVPGTGGSSKDTRSGGSVPDGTAPQGIEIAFNRAGDIHLMNADGSNLRKLRAGGQPEWSPDGTFIAFTSGGGMQFMKSDGSGLQNLRARGSNPSWSPDGGWLAFDWECDGQFGGSCDSPDGTENDCGPECGIGVVARDGSGARRLGNGMFPDWGPNGRIAFTDGTPVGACHYHPKGFGQDPMACTLPIWVMNPDGSSRTRLPIDRAMMPTWSHDGRKIAYYTPTDGVFIANSDGTGIVQVAPAGYEYPSWSPDGVWLALVRYSHGDNPPSCSQVGGCHHSISLRGIDGTSEKRLTKSGNDLQPAFSPRR